MQVSVEALGGLKHKMTISVPAETIQNEVDSRLKNVASKANIKGFRPGKAPKNIVVSRYSDSVREEVAREMVQPTLFEALNDNKLNPVSMPLVEPQQLEAGKDFTYTATFEIFPEFIPNELPQTDIELIESTVQDSDVDAMLDKLREQNKEWHPSNATVAAKGDKVVINFKGFLDDNAFDGGTAEGHELVLGSGSMIPGFEEGIVGGEKDKPFDITVQFPDDYNHSELAGKSTRFNITITNIMQGKLPELDDAFAEKFNINEGGIEALKKDIADNMSRELERRVSSINRERILEASRLVNSFELPEALIEQEIEHLKHDMYHRLFGNEHSDNETIPDFPRELFEEQAKRRVHLGLLFSEYVKKHEIKADEARVDAMIEKFANAYESPDELRNWYKGNKERIAEVEALVMEEMVAEKISEHANIIKKETKYDDVMNPDKNQTHKGE